MSLNLLEGEIRRRIETKTEASLRTSQAVFGKISALMDNEQWAVSQIPDWDDPRWMNLYRCQRQKVYPMVDQAIQFALGIKLGNLNSGDIFIDFGIGEALDYPISGIQPGVKVVAVEPNKSAIQYARDKGRIAQDVAEVTRNEPPYDISQKAQAVIGISSFHVLPRPQMLRNLRALVSQNLVSTGLVCHIQPILPSLTFLQGWDESVYERVGRNIYHKYPGLELKPVDYSAPEKNDFLLYLRSIVAGLDDLVVLNTITGNPEKIPYNPYDLARFDPVHITDAFYDMCGLLGLSVKKVGVEIKNKSKPGLHSLLTAIRSYLDLASRVNPADYNLDIIYAVNIIQFFQNILIEDLFEGYLVDLFQAAGVDAQSELIGLYTPGESSSSLRFINDGEIFSISSKEGVPAGEIATIRVVSGKKKISS
jgi:hypothetical protein